MTLSFLLQSLTDLALTHKQLHSVQTGNVFDVGVAKKSEYAAMWIELPILIDYNENKKKLFTFALNFLTTCKADNIDDAMDKTSDMELVADDMLQAIKSKYTTIGNQDVTGLTLKSFSDDDLVGVRVEMTFMIGRDCDWQENFDRAL
jgi:hypothetical protein